MPDYDSGWAFANAMTLTALLGVVAFLAWRRRGVVSGLRWTGIALVPTSLYLLGLLKTFWIIADELARFFSGLVWSPRSWLGLALAVVAAALIVLPARINRGWGNPSGRQPQGGPSGKASSRPQPADDELAEIEAILKRRGIN